MSVFKVEERGDGKFITINNTEHEIHQGDIIDFDIAQATAKSTAASLKEEHNLSEGEQVVIEHMIMGILK
jgi:hypothetical protein